MDRKSIAILVVSVGLLMLWYPLVNRLYPPPPPGAVATNALNSATNPGAAKSPASSTATPGAPAQSPKLSAQNTPGLSRVEGPEQVVTLDSSEARYTFTSQGGGIKLVELIHHAASVTRNAKKANASGGTNRFATLNTKAPVPAFTLLGNDLALGDGAFTLSKTGNVVRAEKRLTNGLVIIKEFTPSTNYLLNVTMRVENPSAQPVQLPAHELVIGTATPLNPHEDPTKLGLQWYNGNKVERIASTWFDNATLGCKASDPRLLYESNSDTNIVWAAVHNQFFALATLPREKISQVASRRIDLPGPTPQELADDPKAHTKPHGYQTSLVYPGQVIAPNQVLERHYEVYAGPKEYRTLAKFASVTGNNLDLIMQFDGFFGWFAKLLLLGMNGLYSLGLPYGMAIIAIVVIIKALFWPLTAMSTRSMKRMATLQPQMKALQDKYKDDPKKMNMKLMEFMKENKVSPVGGCLPMLIQIPVFFGFFTMLSSAIELRGASFLWAWDLTQPDTLFIIPGLNLPFNLLPLIMTGTTLWQTHLTPPSPGMDPVQQKIMRFMPLMFIVILYNFSSALTLYWTSQNLLSILQMKLTADPKDKPAAPAKAAVVVPAKKK